MPNGFGRRKSVCRVVVVSVGVGFIGTGLSGRAAAQLDWTDYRWRWTDDVTAERLRAESVNVPICLRGPLVPGQCGCVGRFDMDADGDVDLADMAAFYGWLSVLSGPSTR